MYFSLLLTQSGAQSPQVLWSARRRLVVVGTSYMIPIVYRYIDSYGALFLLVYRGIIYEEPTGGGRFFIYGGRVFWRPPADLRVRGLWVRSVNIVHFIQFP